MKKNLFYCVFLAAALLLGACTTFNPADALPVYYSPDAVLRPYTVVGGDVGLAPQGMVQEYIEADMSGLARKKGADAILVRNQEKIGPGPGIPLGAPMDQAEQTFAVLPDQRSNEVRVAVDFIRFE